MNLSRETLGRARILVVGDIMLDRYWFGDVDRISPEAPVPIVHVKREEFRLGGAANVACNIASLGARVTLMSVVGADDAADRVRTMLDEARIAHLLEIDSTLPTTVKLRVGARSQQLIREPSRSPFPNAQNGCLSCRLTGSRCGCAFRLW